ncbi:MAG TPA: TIGR01777 family protein [Planctomycetaceae bacterium]|nr:TIGR01777 family protein [Planctomycetaceae bacterium]
MALRIGITGASGLVGNGTTEALVAAGHDVVPMVRDRSREGLYWNPTSGEIDLDRLGDLDGVIHLAGESIAAGRWNEAKKTKILESRVQGTRLIAESLAQLARRPLFLISASAVGYFGDQGDRELREEDAAGDGFLADVCQAWEEATTVAADAGVRVVNARIGMVLSSKDGALKKMLLPFKLCAGGRIGRGRQYWSWISLHDLAEVLRFAAEQKEISGPLHAVAPQPVTNAEFTRELGRALHRPTLFPMPAFAAKLGFGEMAEALLLPSTRVVPHKLQQLGFEFQHATLSEALEAELAK